MSSNCSRSEKNNEMVQVAVRCRPMSDKEIANNHSCAVRVDTSNNTVEIYNLKQENSGNPKVFTFDAVFDEKSTQGEIYDKMVRPIVDAVLSGYNGTVFAYGQSGSGKTYTMEGMTSDSAKGMLPRTFENIFDHISKSCNIQYLIWTSYIEIYQDEIRDLLDRKTGKKYEVRESKDSGVYVKDISSFVCKSEKEMNRIIEVGRRNRIIASTDMNERSSRSHAIVTITVEMKDLTGPLEGRIRVGKLNLVDLAGSERQNKTKAEGDRLKEANKINLSLSALGNVISALSENKNHHIPYRDSKLTRILKDSLGGNSKTLMIANISPASYNYEESLNTLRYASRAKTIRNDPQVNEDPVDTLIRRYQEEIKRLKCQLEERTVPKTFCSLEASVNDESSASAFKSTLLTKSNDLTESNSEENIFFDNKTKDQEIEDVEDLRKRIELMESRLLIGNKNILEHTVEQKKALEQNTSVINEIKQREKEMSMFLEKEKEIAQELKGDFYNLEHEVEIKKKKLTKTYLKLQATQQEINDAKDEFNADRRELEVTQQEILKEIKLKLLIMKAFVPKELRRQLFSRMFYNEDADCWQLNPISELCQIIPKPKSSENTRRPMTSYSAYHQKKAMTRQDQKDEIMRFKGENILELDLIQPVRFTKDYIPPKVPTALKNIFQAAMKLEEDIDIDATGTSLSTRSYTRTSRRSLESIFKSKCVTTPRRTQSAVNFPVYPKARGLVPK